ncbi:UNVERIFIED_CONTAM: hypothetical protein HDU68_010341 [Siphonaria sp. JEL0065]|nr:hypothetical protein HDU68_010341 [Siphonaria sp. JEL0065]
MASTYAIKAFLYRDSCESDWLERIDYTLAPCVPTTSLDATCQTFNATSLGTEWASEFTFKLGCVASANLSNFSDSLYPTTTTTRVRFDSFSSDLCSATTVPINVTEITGATPSCLKNLSNNTVIDPITGTPVLYRAERLGMNFADLSLYRTYFIDSYCTKYLTSTHFNSTCVDGQTAKRISNVGIQAVSLYSNNQCTGTPTSIEYVQALDHCIPSSSCHSSNQLNSMVSCLDSLDVTSHNQILIVDPSKPRLVLSYFMDPACSVSDYTRSLALGICQPFYNLGTGTTDAFKITFNTAGDGILYSVYDDFECTVLRNQVPYAGDGKCVGRIQATLYRGNGSWGNHAGIYGGVAAGVLVVVVGVVALLTYRKEKARAKLAESTQESNQERDGFFLLADRTTRREIHEVDDVTEMTRFSHDYSESVYQVLVRPDGVPEKEKQNSLFVGLTRLHNLLHSKRNQAKTDTRASEVDGAVSTDPKHWTVNQVADWVSQNGGTAQAVRERGIDGVALMSLTVEELYTVLKISTVGERLRFRRSVEELKVAPPVYEEE